MAPSALAYDDDGETRPRTAVTRLCSLLEIMDERIRSSVWLLQIMNATLGLADLAEYPPEFADHIVADVLHSAGLPHEKIWIFVRTGLVKSENLTPEQHARYRAAEGEWAALDLEDRHVFVLDPMAYVRRVYPLPTADEKRLRDFLRRVHRFQRGPHQAPRRTRN